MENNLVLGESYSEHINKMDKKNYLELQMEKNQRCINILELIKTAESKLAYMEKKNSEQLDYFYVKQITITYKAIQRLKERYYNLVISL